MTVGINSYLIPGLLKCIIYSSFNRLIRIMTSSVKHIFHSTVKLSCAKLSKTEMFTTPYHDEISASDIFIYYKKHQFQLIVMLWSMLSQNEPSASVIHDEEQSGAVTWGVCQSTCYRT